MLCIGPKALFDSAYLYMFGDSLIFDPETLDPSSYAIETPIHVRSESSCCVRWFSSVFICSTWRASASVSDAVGASAVKLTPSGWKACRRM